MRLQNPSFTCIFILTCMSFIMCTIQCALFLSFHYIYSANVLLLYLPYVLNYLWIHRAFLFFSFFPFSFIPKNQTCLTNHDLFKSCFDLPLFQSQASKLQFFWLNAVPSFFSERRSLEKHDAEKNIFHSSLVTNWFQMLTIANSFIIVHLNTFIFVFVRSSHIYLLAA